MEMFLALFGPLIRFYYHCFDRIVIHSMLPNLMQPKGVVYFFREVKGIPCIEKKVLQKRTTEYNNWVEAYTKNRKIPIDWKSKDERMKDALEHLRNRRLREGFTGVYAIYRSMENSLTYRITKPKYKTKDPNHRFLKQKYSRHKHYYFHIIDETLGAFSMRVATYLPFTCTII